MSESRYVNRCLKNTWEGTMISNWRIEKHRVSRFVPLKDEKNSKKWERVLFRFSYREVRKIIIDIKNHQLFLL